MARDGRTFPDLIDFPVDHGPQDARPLFHPVWRITEPAGNPDVDVWGANPGFVKPLAKV